MGCVATRPSMNSPPRGLDKLKMENGYVNGGNYNKMGSRRASGGHKPLHKDYPGKILKPEVRTSSASIGSGGKASDDGGGGGNVQDGKLIKKERESNGSGRIRQEAGKLITKEKERKSGGGSSSSSGGAGGGGGGSSSGGGGNISKKISSMLSKPGEPDELVDGWPKWLTDNIPKGALAGLVPKSADAYDKLEKIGQGTYSNVYKARDRATGKIVALKKVRFETSEPESVKFMAREITILRKLDHPNIVKLEGLATSRMQYSIYLVFGYMITDLSKIIARPDDTLTEPQVKCYMQQLLSGLQHCHARGILHRDIKGSNLLIDRDGMLKIADFGLANYYNPEKKRPLTNRVVTLWYRAPELLLGATDYGPAIDIWSAGCLMAEMFAGRPIMPGRTEVEQLHRIFKLCGTPSEDYWKRLKLSTTFRPSHSYKPSLRDAFRDFPKSSAGLLNILLALDPAYRGSASSALQNEFFHTAPWACDLSGLPVIEVNNNDDEALNNEQKKQRKARMRQRSQTVKERRKKDQANEITVGDSAPLKEEPDDKEEVVVQRQEPSSSVSPSAKQPKSSIEHILSPGQQYKHMSEAHPNATKNIKNRPPLPNGNTAAIRYNNDTEMYRLSLVQRSVSSREYRKMDQRDLNKLSALVD